MNAEDIVRALAAADPHTHVEGTMCKMQCHLCGAFRSSRSQPPEPVVLTDHFVACPWRQAVEWVAAHEELCRALAATDEAGWLTDESGWQSYTEDGRTRIEIVVTSRAKRAMSVRQMNDLRRGGDLIARAFEPDGERP